MEPLEESKSSNILKDMRKSNKATTLSPLSLDYGVTVSLRKDELRQYNGMVLEIKLERQLLQSLVELILPPILLVMVSWVRRLYCLPC